MHYSRVWWWLSFQGPYIFPLIEKRGRGWRKEEGVMAALIEHYGKPSFRSGPCSQLHYLPGGEKHMFSVHNRRDGKLISRHSIIPQEVFHFVWARKGSCAVSPGVGLTKLNLPQQRICAALANTCFCYPDMDPPFIIFCRSQLNWPGQSARLLVEARLQSKAGISSKQVEIGFQNYL